MNNINVYLRENLAAISSKNIFIAPQVDEKKLNNAVKAFGYSGNISNIVALLDTTILGSGKDGLLFTGEQVIYRQPFSDSESILYEYISTVDYVEALTGSKKDKIERSIEVTMKNDRKIVLKNLGDCKYEKLSEILNTVISDFNDYKEEKQLIPITDMKESLKVAYVKVMINMAYDNNALISDKAFTEILLLMTRLNLSSDSRFILLAYMSSIDNIMSLDLLIKSINAECPDGQIKALHISLVKDLINLYFCTGGKELHNFSFFQKNKDLLQVNDKEVELVLMTIENDHNMLKEDFTDEQMISSMKSISAHAAAVGVPLAAVYISGSVIGMSAAGMTSGLATLGMGGLLGLSSMATGIGVAVLIGVGVYHGVRKLTGANELTRSKRRELMLNEVIKQTRETLFLLIEDINQTVTKVDDSIQTHLIQYIKIKDSTSLMNQMIRAGAILAGKSNAAQSNASKLQCAKFLDENKLRSLTREPTKLHLFDFIRGSYEERSVIDSTKPVGDKDYETIKLCIKNSLSNKELEELANAFKAIGYFDVTNVIKGTVIDKADKAKEKFKDFFNHDKKKFEE